MRNFTLALILSLLGLTAFSQVAREMVIMEKGTGTWCTYCPGAAMGADDLIANGCSVAVIAYHSGDPFENTASAARISYYGITGFPTAEFDGVLEYVGGSHTQSMYSNYLPLYNQRIAIPSSFTIEMYGENTGSTYDITLVLTKVASTTATDIRAHLALTESEIPYSWQGMSEVNYAERLMVPDQNGTSVDFSGTTEITLNLQFTIDPSWNLNELELVAFLQDNPTKECLQGTKVMLTDLQPMYATASFGSSSQTPCVASSVQFTDESGGDITSWAWTFEGGNPPTSTLENPEVTYNTLGDYDVQLIVSDGSTTDTLLNPNYITVITAPVQPDMPSGNTELCEGGPSEVYEIDPVPWAATYIWSVTPAAAGTITGIDPVATFTMANGYTGPFEVKVRADNSCGQGTWSQSLMANINITPEDFTLSQGGGYCQGDPGIELTLDGSETGVDYELYLDGDPTGITQAGTGGVLNFGYQTEQGIYSCLAYNTNCENEMIGNSYIFVQNPPAAANTPAGAATVCNDETGVEYTTGSVTGASSYVWVLDPEEAGTISGSTIAATVDWSASYTGSAYISVQAVNDCGSGPFSNELEVAVNAVPEPVISGDDNVCSGDLGVLYFTPDNSGSSYVWDVSGGTIASGAGTHEITVNWGGPGNGIVVVTETSAEDCMGEPASVEVTIDDCTGIGENDHASLNIYPNPVKDELLVEISKADFRAVELEVLNQYGQLVYAEKVASLAGKQQVRLSTNGLSAGVYSLRIKSSDGSMLEEKFVKVN